MIAEPHFPDNLGDIIFQQAVERLGFEKNIRIAVLISIPAGPRTENLKVQDFNGT